MALAYLQGKPRRDPQRRKKKADEPTGDTQGTLFA
jgi:hypothetical protein